jgi:DNA-binding transcriptional MerR regulator
MTEQELICAIRESDRQWQETEIRYKRRRKELTEEHHLLTVDLILLYQEKGCSNEEIKEMIRSATK